MDNGYKHITIDEAVRILNEWNGYTSHFVVCPAAGSFRKRRKSDKS